MCGTSCWHTWAKRRDHARKSTLYILAWCISPLRHLIKHLENNKETNTKRRWQRAMTSRSWSWIPETVAMIEKWSLALIKIREDDVEGWRVSQQLSLKWRSQVRLMISSKATDSAIPVVTQNFSRWNFSGGWPMEENIRWVANLIYFEVRWLKW